MKNLLRSALVLGALVSTPVIAMADPTPSPSGDKAPSTDKADKADKKAPKKSDAKSPSGSSDKTTTDKDQTPPPATK